jgi:hypothetical protein
MIKFFLDFVRVETAQSIWYTGHIGVEKLWLQLLQQVPLWLAPSSEWKAPPTGKIKALLAPASFIFSQANSTALYSRNHKLSRTVVICSHYNSVN